MSLPNRSIAQIDHDLLSVCRRISELALHAEMGMQAPDTEELSRASDGLVAVLRERRAAIASKEGHA